MTHDELNALCAEKVAHFKPYAHPFMKFKNGDAVMIQLPPSYCTDPAAVIELLEKETNWLASSYTTLTGGRIHWAKVGNSYYGEGDTFALAATLALLKAHGVETE